MDQARLTIAILILGAVGIAPWFFPDPAVNAPTSEGVSERERLAAADADFRACDRGYNEVVDPGTASVDDDQSASLKPLSTADADFRANDRDWCHVNDFWTAEVQGLYSMTSAEVSGVPKDPAIRLIELSVASADDEDEDEEWSNFIRQALN